MKTKVFNIWQTYNSKKYSYWVTFTILFGVISAYCLSFFYFSDTSLINKVDGYNQHYVSLLYFKRWEQLLFKGSAPIWDVNIGFGTDVFSTIFYYLAATPLTLFAFLCPERYLEYFYALDIFVRIYMAGIGFSIYAKSKTKNSLAVLLGALTYCFCGFVVQKGFQHLFFVLPMFYFPMMCWGVDRIIKKKSAIPFILFTALNAITSFYFFYMSVIGIILYICAQLFFNETEWKKRFTMLFRFALFGILAVMLSGAILFPIIYQMLGGGRIGSADVPVLYSVKYYCDLLFGCMTNKYRDFDSRTGYVPTVIVFVILLFSKKGYQKLKLAYAGLTLMLCVPIFGSIMNGFAYVSNRWIFMYSFLMSYILVVMMADIKDISLESAKRSVVILVVYIGVMILAQMLSLFDNAEAFLKVLCVAAIVLLVVLGNKKIITISCSIVTIVFILFNIYEEFSPVKYSAISGFLAKGSAIEGYTDNLYSNKLREDIPKSELSQYRSTSQELSNSYMIQGLKGENFYFSVINSSINRLMRSMEINNPLEHQYSGFGDRIALNSLTGVKYSVENGTINKNDYALPLAFCMKNEISEEDFLALPVEARQANLLYNAVVENPTLGLNSDFNVTKGNSEVLLSTSLDIEVYESEKELSFDIENCSEKSEIYVIAEGIHYDGMSPKRQYAEGWKDRDYYTKSIVSVANRTYQEPDAVKLSIKIGNNAGEINYYTPGNRMYAGRDSFVCSLGVLESIEDMVISLNEPGTYKVDSLRVIAIPIDITYEQLRKLKNNDSMELVWGKNEINGKIDASEDELLCITVPFSKGWKVWIDGEKVNPECVDLAFLGINVSSGNHDILLKYELPLFKFGIVASAMGVGFIILYEVLRRKNEISIHST